MKVLNTFLKDIKVSFKTFYIYIEIMIAIISIAILLFVVPENFTSNFKLFVYIDNSINSDEIKNALMEENAENVVLLNSMDEIEKSLSEDRSSVGVGIKIENNKIVYDFVLQGYENQQYRNLIQKSLTADEAKNMPNYKSFTSITTLETSTNRLSDRINMLPVFLLLNSAFAGLFIVATYIFMDKEEGTIRAFAVTPASVWEYLLAKMGVMLVTGLITGLLMTIFVAGAKVNYLHLILLLVSTNLFGTALGLFISSFYDNITNAMGSVMVIFVTFAFATTSYFIPSFSPLLIKILPSYPLVFAFRETFLESPNIGFIYLNVFGFSILALILLIMANHRFKKTITV